MHNVVSALTVQAEVVHGTMSVCWYIAVPLQGHTQELLQRGVSSLLLDPPVLRAAQLGQASLSPAHLHLGQYNSVISKEAVPDYYSSAVSRARQAAPLRNCVPGDCHG